MSARRPAATDADPRRPYKAIATALVAALGVIVAQGQDVVPPWLVLAATVLSAGLAAYATPNPRRRARPGDEAAAAWAEGDDLHG